MSITVHHPKTNQPIFVATSPKRLMRTLRAVDQLRAAGVKVKRQSVPLLRAYVREFAAESGPVYLPLLGQLLAA